MDCIKKQDLMRRALMIGICLLVLRSFLLGSGPVFAFEVLPGDPMIFSQDPNQETNIKPKTSIASNGDAYLCIWEEKSKTTGNDILGKIVDKTGSLQGNIIKINQSSGNQKDPDLDSDGSGYMVVWSDGRDPNITDSGIYGALISNDGTISMEIPIETGSENLRFPRVKWNGHLKHYFVAWEDWKDHNASSKFKVSIYGKRIDQAGQLLDQDPEEIAVDFAFNERGIRASFDLASFEDPNMPSWIIMWNGSFYDPEVSGLDILGKSFNEDPNSGELSSDPFPFSIPLPLTDQYHPSVEGLGNAFLVVWENWTDTELIEKDIQGIHSSNLGNISNGLIDISSAPNSQTLPEVAINGQGYFVVWQDQRDSQPDQIVEHLYGVRFSPGGFVLKDPNALNGTRISTDPNQMPWSHAVASTGSSGDYRYFCFWTAREGSVWPLIGRIYDPPPPPQLSWVGPPNYEEDGVDPNSAFGGSAFTFKVKYVSPEGINAEPEIARILIDYDGKGIYRTEELLDMTGEGDSVTDYTEGRVYFYQNPKILYDGDGILTYRFFFMDKYNVAIGDPNNAAIGDPTLYNTFKVELEGNKPMLDWTYKPGFTEDGARPDGTEWDTNTPFEFHVIYQDEDGDAPQHMELWIDKNGDKSLDPNREKWDMEAEGSFYQQGQAYTKTVTLSLEPDTVSPVIYYKFESDDGKNKAVGFPRSGSILSLNPLGETSACLNTHNQLFPSIISVGNGYQVFWQDQREIELDANDSPIVRNHIWFEFLSEAGRVKDSPGEPGQKRIDNSNMEAFKPLAQFDPENQRTLVIWEDLRNGSIIKPTGDEENIFKPERIYNELDIYGIFIDPNGTFIDPNGEPIIDPNDPNSKREFIIGGSADSQNMLNPDMTMGANGQYIVVWESERRIEHSERTEIWAKFVRYPEGAYGDRIWIDIAVSGRDKPGEGHQLMPKVAWNGEYYLAVWQDIESVDIRTGYYNSRIYGIRIDPNRELYPPVSIDPGSGELLPDTEYAYKFFNDSEGQDLQDPNINQLFPDVASDGENFLIVWQDSRSLGTEGGYDIYGMRVNVNGLAIQYLDKPFRENPICTAEGHQIRPRVFWDNQASQYIIMWLEMPLYTLSPSMMLQHQTMFAFPQLPQLTQAGTIKTVRMDPNGQLIDGPSDEEDKYEGTSIVGVAATQDHPDMACDPNLGCRLIWEDIRNTLFSYDLYSASFQATLNWVDDPNFENRGVNPMTGAVDSTFTFKVEYRDRSDMQLTVSQVWIDLNDNGTFEADEKFDMEAADPNSSVTQGIIYTFAKEIGLPQDPNSDQIIAYRFYFNNEKGQAQGVGSGLKFFSLVGAPQLDWTAETGFISDGVDPNQAKSGSEFRFSVTYTDESGELPFNRQVWIDQDNNGEYGPYEKYTMNEDDAADTDTSDGKVYSFTINLFYRGDGIIKYRFFFDNGVVEAEGEPASDHTLTIISTSKDILWEIYTKDDGLNGNIISSLAVDQNNNLWVGFILQRDEEGAIIDPDSGGISRFNGNEWTPFKRDLDVIALQVTPNDNHLWAWTLDGPVEYDGNSWETYSDPDPNIPFSGMAADNQGRVWFVKSFVGLVGGSMNPNSYSVDPNALEVSVSSKLIRYESGMAPVSYSSSSVTSKGNYISALTTDENEQIWMGIVDFFEDPNGMPTYEYKGIILFDPQTEEDKLLEDVYPGYPGEDAVIGLDKDATGDIWVVSYDTSKPDSQVGLTLFNHEDKTWTHYINGEGGVQFVNNIVRALDRRGDDLWLGHQSLSEDISGGATYHNLSTGIWQVFNSNDSPLGESFNFINDLAIDAEESVWFATINGLARYFPPNTILTFTDDSGFENGVSPSQGISGTEFEFRVQYSDVGDMPPDKAQLWIDLNNDSNFDDTEKFDMPPMDPNDHNYVDGVVYSYTKTIEFDDGADISYKFYFERDGSEVLGTPAGDHVLTINTEPLSKPEFMWEIFHKGKYISDLGVDQANNLWVGFSRIDLQTGEEIDSSSGGMARLDGDIWTPFNENLDVLSLEITPDDHLWAWTSTGLLEYDGSSWRSYSDSDPNSFFFGMASDNQGRVWVVKSSIDLQSAPQTDPNIYSVDPNAVQISSRLIRYQSGLDPIPYTSVIPEGDLINALTTDINGKVWIGINDVVKDPNGIQQFELKMILFDPETVNTKPLEDEYPNYSGGNYIMALDRDNTGDIWVVSYDTSKINLPVALTHFYHNNNTWKTYINGEGGVQFVSNIVSAIDRRGNDLWLGHPQSRGLQNITGGATYHNLSGTKWKFFKNELIEDKTVTEDFNNITALVIDDDGITWFGTSKGLFRYNPDGIMRLDLDPYRGLDPNEESGCFISQTGVKSKVDKRSIILFSLIICISLILIGLVCRRQSINIKKDIKE